MRPSGESTSAQVTIVVTQRLIAATITDCGARSVLERQPAGTAMGSRLTATTVNTGTTLRWSIASNPYVTIDSCNGAVSTLQVLRYSTWPGGQLAVTVTNDGSALGLGTAVTSCTLQITVM